MRIVQLANFVHEQSGGIRTMLDALGRRYAAEGHDVLQIRPGDRYHLAEDSAGRSVMTLPGVPLPSSGGYRLLVRRSPLTSVLAGWNPDVVEVSDKTTLGWVGQTARELDAAAVLMSHERLDLVMGDHVGAAGVMRRAACWHQRRFLRGYDLVVCASRYAASEFEDLDGPPVAVVPFGVDLELFHPDRRHELTGGPLAAAEVLRDGGRGRWRRPRLLMISRLTREKQPSIALTTTRELQRQSIDAQLLVAGDGPLRRAMTDAAWPLRASMLGHVTDRRLLAALVADADVVISPGRRETFGLAALEALASGTPIVAVDEGALPELVVPGTGVTRPLDPVSFADGVRELLSADRDAQRAAARARADEFTWERSGRDLLDRYAALRQRRRPATPNAA